MSKPLHLLDVVYQLDEITSWLHEDGYEAEALDIEKVSSTLLTYIVVKDPDGLISGTLGDTNE